MNFKGIDVSKWQGEIDWKKAKANDVEFVILREGYGKKLPNQKDKFFEQNYEGCKAKGIPCGIYHYSYASSVEDAILEAEFCLENIRGKNFEYPVCFDIEDSEMLVLSSRTRTDICKAFCNIIEQAGYYAMIYCNTNWLKNYLYKDELINRYDLWLAHWGVQVPAFECGIWQYSETGKVNGISGNVDLNLGYKNYPQIMKMKGLNGFKGEELSVSLPKYKTYTVIKGDSLWTIAERFYGSGINYHKIKEFNNLKSNTIYPQQVLKIPN